jgi:hypothetical protein
LDQETVCQEDFLDQYVELCLQAWLLMKFLADSLGLPF